MGKKQELVSRDRIDYSGLEEARPYIEQKLVESLERFGLKPTHPLANVIEAGTIAYTRACQEQVDAVDEFERLTGLPVSNIDERGLRDIRVEPFFDIDPRDFDDPDAVMATLERLLKAEDEKEMITIHISSLAAHYYEGAAILSFVGQVVLNSIHYFADVKKVHAHVNKQPVYRLDDVAKRRKFLDSLKEEDGMAPKKPKPPKFG